MTSLEEGETRAVRNAYVLQISNDIDKPVAYADEQLAKDRAAVAAHDRGVALDPWVDAEDSSFMRAESTGPIFTIYRCPVHES